MMYDSYIYFYDDYFKSHINYDFCLVDDVIFCYTDPVLSLNSDNIKLKRKKNELPSVWVNWVKVVPT